MIGLSTFPSYVYSFRISARELHGAFQMEHALAMSSAKVRPTTHFSPRPPFALCVLNIYPGECLEKSAPFLFWLLFLDSHFNGWCWTTPQNAAIVRIVSLANLVFWTIHNIYIVRRDFSTELEFRGDACPRPRVLRFINLPIRRKRHRVFGSLGIRPIFRANQETKQKNEKRKLRFKFVFRTWPVVDRSYSEKTR